MTSKNSLSSLNQLYDQLSDVVQVLEIGGGSGANFEFVKYPVEWTVVEPNIRFVPYFDKTVEEKGGKHKIKPLVEVSL